MSQSRAKIKALCGTVLAQAPGHMALAALPVPSDRRVQAFTTQDAIERWGEEAAGLRPKALALGDNVITMFGTIGEDFWSESGGITAKKVAAQLNAIGERDIEVQINSPGGDVFEGIAIYNLLREHPGNITVKVLGMAASAASVIAMAGDRIEIGAASFMMIHNTWVMAMGNRHDLREVADFLEPFDAALASVYSQRSGQEVAKVAKLLDAETYMSGAQAIDLGFADALLPSDQVRVDENAQASDKRVNEVRALELQLIKAGQSRSQARASIQRIKGSTTPGAGAPADEPTPGAGFDVNAANRLLETIRGA